MENKLKTYRIRVKIETATTFLVDEKDKNSALEKIDNLLNTINCFDSKIFNEDKKFYYYICDYDSDLDE